MKKARLLDILVLHSLSLSLDYQILLRTASRYIIFVSVHGSSGVSICVRAHTHTCVHEYARARAQRVHRPIHNIPGRNTAWGATSRRWFHRTTPRDGNGRDNYLDSGGYMLPSAAWDPGHVVSMVPPLV